MSPAEIKDRDLFPYKPLAHPHRQSWGGRGDLKVVVFDEASGRSRGGRR